MPAGRSKSLAHVANVPLRFFYEFGRLVFIRRNALSDMDNIHAFHRLVSNSLGIMVTRRYLFYIMLRAFFDAFSGWSEK
jgi:hypothetical protein